MAPQVVQHRDRTRTIGDSSANQQSTCFQHRIDLAGDPVEIIRSSSIDDQISQPGEGRPEVSRVGKLLLQVRERSQQAIELHLGKSQAIAHQRQRNCTLKPSNLHTAPTLLHRRARLRRSTRLRTQPSVWAPPNCKRKSSYFRVPQGPASSANRYPMLRTVNTGVASRVSLLIFRRRRSTSIWRRCGSKWCGSRLSAPISISRLTGALPAASNTPTSKRSAGFSATTTPSGDTSDQPALSKCHAGCTFLNGWTSSVACRRRSRRRAKLHVEATINAGVACFGSQVAAVDSG